MKTSRSVWWLLLALPAFMLGCDASAANRSGSFRLAQVDRGDIHAVVTVAGTLKPLGEVEVGSQVSGRIAELLVDFNDAVTAGQVIARIDPEAFEAQLRRAEAGLRDAEATLLMRRAAVRKVEAGLSATTGVLVVIQERSAAAEADSQKASRTLERMLRLKSEGVVAQDAADQSLAEYKSLSAQLRAREAEEEVQVGLIQGAEAEIEVAKAELAHAQAVVAQRRATLEEAQVALGRTEIRSPIDGVVIDRRVAPGQTVAASLEAPILFRIARNLREMEIHAKVDEADIGQMREGQKAVFSLASNLGQVFDARVIQVRKAPQLLDNVVTYTVVLLADNSTGALLPGMTAIIEVSVQDASDVVRVPNEALDIRPAWRAEALAVPAIADAGEAVSFRGAESASDGSRPAVVWKLDRSGRPSAVPVRIGVADAQKTELASGQLSPGERVIVGYEVNY